MRRAVTRDPGRARKTVTADTGSTIVDTTQAKAEFWGSPRHGLARSNFHPYRCGRHSLRRSWFLLGVDRWVGLDLYVVALK